MVVIGIDLCEKLRVRRSVCVSAKTLLLVWRQDAHHLLAHAGLLSMDAMVETAMSSVMLCRQYRRKPFGNKVGWTGMAEFSAFVVRLAIRSIPSSQSYTKSWVILV